MNFDAQTHQISHPLRGTAYTPPQWNLTIVNPDDISGPPAYDGDPNKVHQSLVPGVYSAIIEDMATDRQADVKVYVFASSTVLGRFVMVGE